MTTQPAARTASAAAPTVEALPGPVEARVRDALLATYFKSSWASKGDSDAARSAIHDHTRGRFDVCRQWLVPWLRSKLDLSRARVVEIGCGTGSSTAAIALEARAVDAYDIAGVSVEAARRRLEIMGLANTRFHEHAPEDLLGAMERAHAPGSVDCVLLYAVLEHQKHTERLETLRRAWALLRPGGALVVGDTPSRLTWWDHHTAWLPFFNTLPPDLALDYLIARSPRENLRTILSEARSRSEAEAHETLVRWGRGVSHHEFELALGDLEPLIAGDGFDPEPLGYFGVALETRLLYTYARRKPLAVPPAFLRETIELVLRKPGGPEASTHPWKPRDLDAIVRPLVDPPPATPAARS